MPQRLLTRFAAWLLRVAVAGTTAAVIGIAIVAVAGRTPAVADARSPSVMRARAGVAGSTMPASTRAAVARARAVTAWARLAALDRVEPQLPWRAGDLHTHSTLSHGSQPEPTVLGKALDTFGLDWVANTDHGGESDRDALGRPLPASIPHWQALARYSFPVVAQTRAGHPADRVIQGVEWAVPGHEHASVGIVADEPEAVAQFEYRFDANAVHTPSVPSWPRAAGGHTGAVSALAWLRKTYPRTSYCVINHPSRTLAYSIADLRSLNDAAPDVCFGLEGIPGRQKAPVRGSYNAVVTGPDGKPSAARSALARTYGGADRMVAAVGGVWDCLFAEGRRVFVFADSDFHSPRTEFWPGEYAKTWVHGRDGSYVGLLDGMRSGDSFVALGDLADRVSIDVVSRGRVVGGMGDRVTADPTAPVELTIAVRTPARDSRGRTPKLDHIDLIMGHMTARARPGSTAYAASVSDARVVKRFDVAVAPRGADGWYSATYSVPPLKQGAFFRLRGTNLPVGTPREISVGGDPIVDTEAGPNDAGKAWNDLWFYSSPVWVVPAR